MSADGRSADTAGLDAMYGAAGANCEAASISAASFAAEAWTWPGAFDFNALDSALNTYFQCANAAAVVVSTYDLSYSTSSRIVRSLV